VHAQPLTEPARLIDELAARAPVAVDLLQADDVRAAALDLAGDPFEVEPAVDAGAVVDVVFAPDRQLLNGW
jgi:hypothetical protein